jgi:putative tryptophan/tyrosine transport system substrate-binding protein
MRRRDFITLIGGAAAAWPLAARGQQSAKRPTIGLLVAGTRASHGTLYEILVQRLSELGWIDGHTVSIDYRWTEGNSERAAEIAAEFIHLGVDAIVTNGNASILATKHATNTIPIIFPIAGDPVGTGLVASLSRPGGNITGLSIQSVEVAGKRLELFREVVPTLRRVGILFEAANAPSQLEMTQVQIAAGKLGLDAVPLDFKQGDDAAGAIEKLKDRTDALYVVGDPLINTYRIAMSEAAIATRLPTLNATREDVEAGSLMAYSPSYADLFRRAAELVDKILRGTKPADVPVEQPTKFELVINLKTAKALGLAIPHSLLVTADEVIE